MNKLYVAISLIRLLNERKKVTAREVADELDVSLRTAQRYMSDMSYLPGVCYDEDTHEWFLAEKYHLSDSYISSVELNILNALFEYAKKITNKDSSIIDKLRRKIITASASRPMVSIIGDDSEDFDGLQDKIELLEKYIDASEEISFYYTNKEKSYTVSPLRFIFHNGFWYLAAKHDGVIKKFTLEYIESVKPTGKAFIVNSEEYEHAIDSAKSIFFGDTERCEVVVTLGNAVADYFRRKEFLPSQRIIGENEDGIVISFEPGNRYECVNLLIGWLPHVRIDSPHEYREEFLKVLNDTVAFNNRASDKK